MTWEPIETAPKDGTWIWARREKPLNGRLDVSAFKFDAEHRSVGSTYTNGMWFAGTGWWYNVPGRVLALGANGATPCHGGSGARPNPAGPRAGAGRGST